jgi:hypothetical protein
MMAAVSLEKRVAALEAEVARLRARIESTQKPVDPWLDKVWGSFANDPVYEEAMRLGREYRESLRPKPAKKRKR